MAKYVHASQLLPSTSILDFKSYVSIKIPVSFRHVISREPIKLLPYLFPNRFVFDMVEYMSKGVLPIV